MKLPDALRALRHRNYRLFFAGQLISLSGTWMQSVAQAWLAYRLTGSAALLGIVGFAGQIPTLLFSPAGGLVADRFARRRQCVKRGHRRRIENHAPEVRRQSQQLTHPVQDALFKLGRRRGCSPQHSVDVQGSRDHLAENAGLRACIREVGKE